MSMNDNTDQVLISIDRTVKAKRVFVGQAVKKVLIDAYTSIVLGSPVDTGRFRASTFLVAGQTAPAPLDPLPKSSLEKHRKARSKVVPLTGNRPTPDSHFAGIIQKNIKEAPETLKALNSGIPQKEASFMIINSLPYAQALENGHSKQSPNGMFRLAYEAAKRQLQQIREATT